MWENIDNAPWTFWLHFFVLVGLVFDAYQRRKTPWILPALVVYGTVAFWYTGDYLLSEPLSYTRFKPEILTLAFFQVALFLCVFRALLPPIAKKFTWKPLYYRNILAQQGRLRPTGQFSPRFIHRLLIGLILGWLGIFATGIYFAEDLWPALIWPPLHHVKVVMYPLVGLGSGNSFIFTTMGYVHLTICSIFGVVAVLVRGPTRWMAILMMAISWPYFWFDRVRNKIIALVFPGMITLWLTGRHPLAMRLVFTIILVLVVHIWFLRVSLYRSYHDMRAFTKTPATMEAEHHGLDMLKELCWINTFISEGTYRPNWGQRYFAELVNPIPRALWPGKPMVGIDYAIARGFGGAESSHGVHVTIATGMIGQGCVNFGSILGVVAAAGLFAFWAAFLARLWCQRSSLLRLMLFLLGMGLTFNTGRDFTLLVLFPFVFAYVAVIFYEKISGTRMVENPHR